MTPPRFGETARQWWRHAGRQVTQGEAVTKPVVALERESLPPVEGRVAAVCR